MKILFCIGSLEKGGAERVISNLANSFVENNDISIVTTISKKEYKIDNRVKLFCLTKENNRGDFFGKLKKLHSLKNVIKEVKPDVIVAFLREPIFRLMLLRPFIKCPIILSVRNDPKKEYNTKISKLFLKFLYPKADGFVFQTQDAKEYFEKKIQDKSIVIPNPIKKEFLERPKFVGNKENKIVAVGRLEPQKNHELLIDAFYELKDKLQEYRLIIYGEGSLRNKLEEKIRKLNLQDKVFLPGNVDNIAEKIENAKLYVMTSDYEGMPNSLMEAMALGLICISTDCPCGGPKFLISDKITGFLFNVGDKNILKKIIIDALNNYEEERVKQLSENARCESQKYSEEKINIEWYKYIQKISNNL